MDTTALPDISLKKYDKAILGLMTVALLGAVGAAGFALYVFLPVLITLAQETLYLGLMAFAGIFLLILFAELWMNLRTFLLKMKLMAKSIRKAVIKSDPIGTIEVAIQSLRDKLAHAQEQKQAALAAQKVTEANLAKAQANVTNEDRLTSVAKTEGEQNLHAVGAQRWQTTADTLSGLLDKQRARAVKIADAEGVCSRGIDNLVNQKQTLQMQLEALQADAAQARAFKAFFGHSEEMEQIDIAVDEIEKQSAACEAEVEQMLSEAEPMLDRAHLQEAADVAQAQARQRLAAKGPRQLAAPGETTTVPRARNGVVVEQKR